MDPSPVNSFTKNLIGFAVFLGVSFGVTYGVNMYTMKQTQEQQVAAAAARMLEPIQR